MRIAALRQLSKLSAERLPTPAAPEPSPSALNPRLVRCECRGCGAHSNAIAARDVEASCPNCGASRLVPVEGAGVIMPAGL
jgi:ribosomal protein S27E